MTKDNTNFIDPSKKTLYGKHGAEFWIGKIVAYADQKEQIEEGFGWRYKVIILGDNSETDQVEEPPAGLDKRFANSTMVPFVTQNSVAVRFQKEFKNSFHSFMVGLPKNGPFKVGQPNCHLEKVSLQEACVQPR